MYVLCTLCSRCAPSTLHTQRMWTHQMKRKVSSFNKKEICVCVCSVTAPSSGNPFLLLSVCLLFLAVKKRKRRRQQQQRHPANEQVWYRQNTLCFVVSIRICLDVFFPLTKPRHCFDALRKYWHINGRWLLCVVVELVVGAVRFFKSTQNNINNNQQWDRISNEWMLENPWKMTFWMPICWQPNKFSN